MLLSWQYSTTTVWLRDRVKEMLCCPLLCTACNNKGNKLIFWNVRVSFPHTDTELLKGNAWMGMMIYFYIFPPSCVRHTRTQATHRLTTCLVILPPSHLPQTTGSSQEGNRCRALIKKRKQDVRAHTYLAVLRRVEDVHCAGLDAVGLGPSVQSEAALSAAPVSAWKRAIVPGRRQTKTSTWK